MTSPHVADDEPPDDENQRSALHARTSTAVAPSADVAPELHEDA